MTETKSRDAETTHIFTDFEKFAKAVNGAVLLKLDFQISTELREDIDSFSKEWRIQSGVPTVRYWMITVF